MKLILTLVAIVSVSGCSREEEALPAPKPRPVAKKPLPPPEPPAPLPTNKPEPAPPPAQRPKRPVPDAAPGTHLPAFTIRTMDHKKVAVELDGEKLVTPCLWSLTSSFRGDAPGPVWPPEGARFAANSRSPEDPDSTAEVYVLSAPGLRPGECLLAVKGAVDGVEIRGTVRLYVEGYHFTVYTPLDIPEGEDAGRFSRTLWFERISDQ